MGRELFLVSTHDPHDSVRSPRSPLLLSSVSRRALGKLIPIKASRYATAMVQGDQGGIHRLGGDEKGRETGRGREVRGGGKREEGRREERKTSW